MIRRWPLILGILILVLATRMFFAVQTPYFSSDESYFHAAIVKRIVSGESPWIDSFGYGGRDIIISPLFEAVLAVFSLLSPFALKFLPNFFASLLVIPVFLLAFRLTRNLWISSASALLSSFVPVFISKTFNHVSPLTLALPLFFSLVYAWLSDRHYAFVALLIFSAFLHPIVIVFVLSVVLYFILSGLDRLSIKRSEYELGVFTIFFTIWVQLLLFKKLIVFHTSDIIWRNIPSSMLSVYFSRITLIGAIVQIGIYPVVQGIYGLYKIVSKNPGRDVNFLFSVVLVSCILLWVKVIDLSSGLMLLGIALAVLFSNWSLAVYQYLKKTRVAGFAGLITLGTVLVALTTTAYPAYLAVQSELSSTISLEEVQALEWVDNSLPADAVVLSPVDYGHYVSFFGNRKTVMDSYFFLQEGVDERFEDVKRVFKTAFHTEAVEIFDKYYATHLLIPPGVSDIKYSGSCFSRVYSMRTRIYEKDTGCHVEVVA